MDTITSGETTSPEDNTKLTVRVVLGKETMVTRTNPSPSATVAPISSEGMVVGTRKCLPGFITSPNQVAPAPIIVETITTEKDTKLSEEEEEKKKRLVFRFVSYFFVAVVIILAGALGGTLGKSMASSDTNTAGTLSTPSSQATIITVMVDPTVCVTPPCMDFNLTAITLIRCRLINSTNMNNGDVTLASWMESNGTIITIQADNPLNQGNCTTGTNVYVVAAAPVFGVEPVIPVSANFSVAVPPTTNTNAATIAYQACMANARLRIKGCKLGNTVIPPTPSASITPSNIPHNYWYNGVRGNYGVNDELYATVEFNGKLYIGGYFNTFGDGSTSCNYIAAWDGSTNTWLTLPSGNSNGLNDQVNALAVYNNKLYIGGLFDKLADGTTTANYIVAWDGSVFSPLPSGNSNGVDDEVYALIVYNNKLYIGGAFMTLGDGTSVKRIAVWDGSVFSTLSSGNSNGLNNQVYALTVYNSKLFIGGAFTKLGDGTTTANYIVAWDSTASTWSTLGPSGVNNGLDSSVRALTVYNNKLYLGGGFSNLGDGTTSAQSIVAWDSTANTWSVLPIGTSNGFFDMVLSLAVYNNKLYIGGQFDKLADGTTSANYIVAWDGSVFSPLPSGNSNGVDSTVYALTLYNNTLYIGGSFSNLGDGTTSALRIVAWDSTSWSVPQQTTPTLTGLSNSVNAIVSYNSKIYVGGYFTSTTDGSLSVNHIAAYDPSTLTMTNLPSGTNGNGVGNWVNALAVYNNKLFIGGFFSTLGDGSTSAKYIVAWDGSTWSTLGPSGASNGVGNVVHALTVYNNKLYIGGEFTNLGDGTTAYYVATYDGTTLSSLASFGITAKMTNTVRALTVYKNQLYIGGSFSNVSNNAITANNIVAYNGNTFTNLSYGTSNGVVGTIATVIALTVYNDKLYIGGAFTSLGDGTYAKNLVRWDGTTFTNVTATTGSTIDDYVYSFGVVQGTLYMGGSFTSLSDGSAAKRVVGYDGASWTNVTFGSAMGIADGEVKSLYGNGTTLYIGGTFTKLGDGKVVNYLAWTDK